MIDHLIQNEEIEKAIEINRTSHANQWLHIPSVGLSNKGKFQALRLNSLGSLFYFTKVTLRKHRLSNNFHRLYCSQFECEHLLEVNEVPRDHFKTTIGIGAAMWWALPFTDKDENTMRALGYDDTWIAWMKRAHDQNTRTLIAMETIKNAWKCGKKITGEYKSNDLFRSLFPEILPDSSCQWSQDTMTHMRNMKSGDFNQGEGTYEFTGIDAALQSKHYCRFILDDLFGKDALNSDTVANDTWEWIKLVVGAFDSLKNDPDSIPDVICNWNRWSFKDLSYMMRQANMGFRFHTHDAEGGCCANHLSGVPIFPEEFSMKKLARLKHWLGEYLYSCQFRNKPIPPGGNKFKLEWLRYFVFTTLPISHPVPPRPEEITRTEREVTVNNMLQGGLVQYHKTFGHGEDGSILKTKNYKAIRHQAVNGIIRKDIPTNQLIKTLFLDPNHAGEKGRSRNCLLAVGMHKNPLSLYMLEGFAEVCSREDTIQKAYEIAERWRIRTIWVEGAAGQAWIQTLLDITNKYRKKDGKWYFDDVLIFRDNRNENAKNDRIEDTEPFFRRGEVYLNPADDFTTKFKEEYEEYPHSRTKDIMDTFGHVCENIDVNMMSDKDMHNLISQQQSRVNNSDRSSFTGY